MTSKIGWQAVVMLGVDTGGHKKPRDHQAKGPMCARTLISELSTQTLRVRWNAKKARRFPVWSIDDRWHMIQLSCSGCGCGG